MEDLLQDTLSHTLSGGFSGALSGPLDGTTVADGANLAGAAGLGPATSANGMVFLLVSLLGLLMALVYVPIRLFLTITARSRRLRLLQRIRRLRENLAQPLETSD